MIPALISGPGSRLYVSASEPPVDSDLYPSYSTLTLMIPRPTGNAGLGATDGLESTNRISKAYTGIEYTIPVDWRGGTHIISTVDLSNAPTGMVAERYTTPAAAFQGLTNDGWQIRWPSPDATANNIVVTITDNLGNTDSRTYSITVGTSGFKFIDSVSGDNTTGTGTLAAPWQTLAHARTNCSAGDILYFRAGTYTVVETVSGTPASETAMDYDSASTTHIWIGYPGETVNINHGYAGGGVDVPYLLFDGLVSSWFQNLNFINAKAKSLYLADDSGHGSMIWKCTFTDMGPALDDGTNPAVVGTDNPGGGACRRGHSMIACDFNNLTDQIPCKFYASGNVHLFGTVFRCESGARDSGGVAFKFQCPSWQIVNCVFTEWDIAACIGGNFDYDNGTYALASGGEFAYNLALDGGDLNAGFGVTGVTNAFMTFLKFAGDHPRGAMWFFRNTIIGQFYAASFASDDGQIIFKRNVIINPDGAQTPQAYIFDASWTDNTKFTLSSADNVLGAAADSIVDVNGLLQGAFRTANGPGTGDDMGHELP